MAEERISTRMLYDQLHAHVRDCSSLRERNTAALDRLTRGLSDINESFDVVKTTVDSYDSVIRSIRKTLVVGGGAILLAVLSSAAGVIVQERMSHDESTATAVKQTQAIAKVDNDIKSSTPAQ